MKGSEPDRRRTAGCGEGPGQGQVIGKTCQRGRFYGHRFGCADVAPRWDELVAPPGMYALIYRELLLPLAGHPDLLPTLTVCVLFSSRTVSLL